LFTAGVLPYYLHLLDKAKGTAHFELTEREAVKIHQVLQHNLPGYLVLKLVKEQSGHILLL
jgi:L-lysine 2,3-aminomutase